MIVAYISARTDEQTGKTAAWWTTYLQNLSTGLIGIAATVWLVNFLSEFQRQRSSSELRASNEIAAFLALQRFIERLPHWLPPVKVPDNVHLFPLQWLQNQIENIGNRCDAVTPGTDDPDLQTSLDDFRLRRYECTDALTYLLQLIQMPAPAEDRALACEKLQGSMKAILLSAETLKALLGNYHDFRKLKLGIPRV